MLSLVGALLLHLPYLLDKRCTSTCTHQSDSEINPDGFLAFTQKAVLFVGCSSAAAHAGTAAAAAEGSAAMAHQDQPGSLGKI
jgi:hypothetical protein